MSEAILFELKVFLVFLLHGGMLLLCSDILASFRLAVRHNTFWVSLEDVLFCFLAAVWTFLLIFICQDGVLRLYTAAGMGAGMYLYRKTVSRWVVGALWKLFRLLVDFFLLFRQKIDKIRKKWLHNLSKKDRLKRNSQRNSKKGKKKHGEAK